MSKKYKTTEKNIIFLQPTPLYFNIIPSLHHKVNNDITNYIYNKRLHNYLCSLLLLLYFLPKYTNF